MTRMFRQCYTGDRGPTGANYSSAVVDRRDIGSWLEGPGARQGLTGHPGARLGLPASGPGSIGRFGRRVLGALIDWTLAQAIAYAVFGVPLLQPVGGKAFVPLAVFAAENLLLVGTVGYTLGHRIVGLQVRSLDGGPARPLQVLVRTALLCLFLPAMFWDRDGRGLHDRSAGTVIVRT